MKKSISMHVDKPFNEHQRSHHHIRTRRSSDMPSTAYIAARIEADEMRKMYSADRPFLVGDDKVCDATSSKLVVPHAF